MKPPPSVDNLLSKLVELQVQELEILWQLEQARRIEFENKEKSSIVPDHPATIFSVTDRVIVMNRVRVANVKTVSQNNQQATVTAVNNCKVHFTSNNGTKT